MEKSVQQRELTEARCRKGFGRPQCEDRGAGSEAAAEGGSEGRGPQGLLHSGLRGSWMVVTAATCEARRSCGSLTQWRRRTQGAVGGDPTVGH